MRRSSGAVGASGPALGAPRGGAAVYRVTVATAESSSLSAGPGTPRAFVSARGANGAVLGPWPLARSGGTPALARGTADAFILSAPTSAGPLTHAALWLEGPPSADKKASSWLGGLGGGGASAAWNVRWLAIEELPAAGAGASQQRKPPRAPRRARGSDDDDSDDASSEDDGDDAGADASPVGRLYFFPVDKAVPRASGPRDAAQLLEAALLPAAPGSFVGAPPQRGGPPAQGAQKLPSDGALPLLGVIAALRRQVAASDAAAAAAQASASASAAALRAAQTKLAAASQPPPKTPPPPPRAAPPPPRVVDDADAEAALELRALACEHRQLRRRHLAAFREWAASASAARALRCAWLRVAQRVVRRMGVRALRGWAAAVAEAHAARKAEDAPEVAAEARCAAAERRFVARQNRALSSTLLAWRDAAAWRHAASRVVAAARARAHRRTLRAWHAVASRRAAKTRSLATAESVWAARRRRRGTASALYAWRDAAADAARERREAGLVPISEALALLARRPAPPDTSAAVVQRSALLAWRGRVAWCRRAAFLVRRCGERRQTATLRAAARAWRDVAAETCAERKEWRAGRDAEGRLSAAVALRAWRASYRATTHDRRRIKTAAWRLWRSAIDAAHAAAAADIVARRADFGQAAAALRGWHAVAIRLRMHAALLRGALAASAHRRARSVLRGWADAAREERVVAARALAASDPASELRAARALADALDASGAALDGGALEALPPRLAGVVAAALRAEADALAVAAPLASAEVC